MLDIKLIRKEPKEIEKKIQTKEPSITLAPLLELDEKIRNLKTESEHLKSTRNDLSKKIGELKRSGQPVEDLMKEVNFLAESLPHLEAQLEQSEKELNDLLSRIPNIPMDDIFVSLDKNDNICIKEVGKKRETHFVLKNHVELNERHQLFDFKRGAKTSGSGWPAYRDMGARLEWALINYMIETQIKNGFVFWMPPLLVKREILYGSGQIPKFDGQYYEVPDTEGNNDQNLYLVPTAEVVLNGFHYDEIIPEENLPIKYCAYTPCFRKEAGAAGAQERGLIRVHQFNKVEMFAFARPEESMKIFDQMIANAEEILQGLELHYRNMLLVTGDMSFTAARTVDIEVWLPGQNRYYEVSSVSNCTDYQARRSNTRYKAKQGKPELVHTLNGSGLATSRLMVALLENNQQEDGSIILPKVLQKKLGVERLIPNQ